MNIREVQRSQPTPVPISSRPLRVESDSHGKATEGWRNREKSKASTRTLSPVPSTAMNALHSSIPTLPASSSSIRSVPSDPPLIDTTIGDENKKISLNKSDPMPHSTRSEPTFNTSSPHSKNASLLSQSSASLSVSNANSIQRRVSSEFGPTVAYANSASNPNLNGSSSHAPPGDDEGGGMQWNSAVGRASLGKSGRVIERLQAENDKLRRNLNIEKTRAEESKRDASNIEAKMDEQKRDYEAKLHLAVMDKTMLRRRDRQLADLRAQIDGERNKANAAIERELVWKTELERVQSESKRAVEVATDKANMLEAMNKTMTNHWKERRGEVDNTVKKMGKEIEKINQERKADDHRMNTLQALCAQQAQQLKTVEAEKAAIMKHFEEYILLKEESLVEIKRNTLKQDQGNEDLSKEMIQVLGELKWALGVHKNVKSL